MENAILIRIAGVTLSLFLLTQSFSQNLNIVYDAQSGKLNYFQDGVEVSKPNVKKGDLITLRIENYNNYLYDVNIEEKHLENKIGNGENPLGGIQGFGFGDIFKNVVPSFSIDADADGVADFMDIELDNLTEEERQIRQLKLSAEQKLSTLRTLESHMQETALGVTAYEKQQQFKSIALEEVEKLKMNPRMPPAQIKDYAVSIITKALNMPNLENSTLFEAIEKNDGTARLTHWLEDNKQTARSYESGIGELKYINQQLLRLAPGRADLASNYIDMEKAFQEAPVVLETADGLSQKLADLAEAARQESGQEVMDIWYEYQALTYNDFSTTYRAEADGDIVVLDVNFQLKETAQASGAPATIAVAPIKIPVHGGLKLNASVGINFGQYFHQPQSFFVRDSTIRGQNEDSFLPMVATNLHFYGQGRKAVNVGGTLGIGIPLGGDVGFQSINFFLGPSIFFGQSDRFVFNLGVMGGKVKRLSAGYSEGNYFDGETEFIPVHYPYELGYFVGLSFNLNSVGQ
ncbi:MAG: hypothetical protein R2830_05785 [Saprospiraceae bacterium]